MIKTVKPGQLVTCKNIVYRAKKCAPLLRGCNKCDLYEQCPHINFECSIHTYFKRI